MKTILYPIGIPLLAALTCFSSAFAADLMDLDLDALANVKVTAASRKAEGIKAAPSNITVVNSDQIKEWGCRDLNDVAVRIAGFTSIMDRDEDVFAVRGNVSDNNQKYMILIDGHPFNSFENFGPANLVQRPNDLSNVKQIEFIRGPGAVAWGPGALAGVINIVTKDGGDLGGLNYLTTGRGSFNTWTMNFQAGAKIGTDSDLIISGAFVKSDGEVINQAASAGFSIAPPAAIIPGYSPPKQFNTLYRQQDPSFMLQGKVRVGEFKVNAYTYQSSMFNRHIESDLSRKANLDNQRSFIEGSFDKVLPDGLNVSAKISYQQDHTMYNAVDGIPFTTSDVYYGGSYTSVIGNYAPSIIDWNDRVFNLNGAVGKSFLNDNLDVNAGVDVKLTHFGPNMRTDSLTSAYPFDRQYDETVLGGYVSLDYKAMKDLRFSAATWIDHNKDRGKEATVLCPRAAVIWDVDPTLTLKAVYNISVLRPANFQMGKPNTLAINQPDSETMNQAELIVMKRFQGLNFTVTAFSQKLSKFINIGNNFVFQNLGDYQSKGVEFEVGGNVVKDLLDAWANLSYASSRGLNFNAALVSSTPDQVRTDATDVRADPNGKLLNYPSLMGNLGVTLRVMNRQLFFSPSLRYQNSIHYRVAGPAASTATSWQPLYGDFGSRVLVDLSMGYEPSKKYGIYLSAHNLADDNDPAPLSIYNGYVTNPGRYVECKVKFSF